MTLLGTAQTPPIGTFVFAIIFNTLLAAIILAWVVPAIITWWKLFEKASRPGWAAIVPVYNFVVMADVGKSPFWMGLTTGILSLLGGSFSQSPFGFVISVGTLVLSLLLVVGMARQYDRGAGFWVLAILLPIVAVFLVGNARYTGEVLAPAEAGNAPKS